MASSDIIKIGFDYRSSLAQFEKDTNGVFDGISSKAGKQKITIQLDAKDDKVIDKIKELQKLKLDKFTFEFGNSGLKEQLQTFDKLENKINEIINLSKGIGNSSAPIVDVNKSSKEIDKLENKISELNKKYDELQKKSATGGISGKEVNLVDNDEFKKLSQEVSELKDQFDDLKTHMSLLDDYTVPTDRFFELQTQVEATSVKVSNLVDEMTRLSNVQKNIGVETNISLGDSKEQSTEIDLYHNLEKRKVTYDEIIDKIQTIVSLKEKEKSLSKTSDDTKLYQNLYDKNDINWAGDTEGTINRISDRLKEIYTKYNGKISLIDENDIQEATYLLDILKGSGESPNLNKSQEKFYQNKKFSNDSLFDNIRVDSQKAEEIDKINTELSETYRWFNQLEGVSLNENIANEIKSLISDMQIGGKTASEYANDLLKIFNIEAGSNSAVKQQNKLQSELKETESQAEKTAQAVNESSSTTPEKDLKDAFPDKDVSTSVEAATNSIKEENNVLEQNTQKVKENADAKKKLADTDKESSNVNLSKYDNRLESYTKKTSGYDATITRFENGGWTSDTYKQRVNAVKEAVAEYERILSSLKNNPDLVTEENLNKLNKQEKLIKDNITAVQNMSAAEKGYSLISAQKELDKINNILKEHSGMSREAKNQIKAYYAEIKSGNPSASLDVIHGKIMQIVNAEIEAGRGGKSMLDVIKEKAWYGVASAIGTHFDFNDFIRYGKEGISIVRQLDTALTEMRKVSNESVQSLKKYQDTTFDTADAVGTIAKQIQNSTADWMRLGENMDTAAKSAKDANILLNVSEFEGIDEATESLVSMSQAYKDLDKMDIIDVLNNIGNNYSISTDGLATALKDSASALVTANNDLNEAVSLTTAGNAITQDPSKVGAGLRTISLRLVGTTQAKQELEDLGEETDGMITTASKLRDTIQSATSAATKDGKGLDIFDSNGNYKSTYEIMQGLADLYDEIVKKDKELGTNNLNLLLETIAGKNRSNIAASILQNGDMLRSVYEDAQNSKGSAENELNAYLDSVDGKFQQLQNRAQEFWYNVIDTTTVKSVLDFTTDLTEGASKFFKLVEKHLPTILGAIATIIASNKSGGLIRLINFINNSPFLATVEFNREVCELIV